jgi:hypothetical protein
MVGRLNFAGQSYLHDFRKQIAVERALGVGLRTVLSIKAMVEPTIVVATTAREEGALTLPARIMGSSQGSTMDISDRPNTTNSPQRN